MTDTNIIGGQALDRLLQTLPVKMEKSILRGALRAGAAVYLEAVKQKIPVRSGQLRASARITTRVRRGQVSASVKVGNFVAWYAHLVEFGTRPHVIDAKPEQAGATGRVGNSLRIGSQLVGPHVQHPGTRGQPFMRPAADEAQVEALRAVVAYIRKRMTKAGINAPDVQVGDEE